MSELLDQFLLEQLYCPSCGVLLNTDLIEKGIGDGEGRNRPEPKSVSLDRETTAVAAFVASVSDEEIRRERQKARDLRSSQWWKRRCSSGLCYYCGKKFSPRSLTMDHIVPIVRGGRSTKGNVAPACKECNTAKKHKLLMEWEEYAKS